MHINSIQLKQTSSHEHKQQNGTGGGGIDGGRGREGGFSGVGLQGWSAWKLNTNHQKRNKTKQDDSNSKPNETIPIWNETAANRNGNQTEH